MVLLLSACDFIVRTSWKRIPSQPSLRDLLFAEFKVFGICVWPGSMARQGLAEPAEPDGVSFCKFLDLIDEHVFVEVVDLAGQHHVPAIVPVDLIRFGKYRGFGQGSDLLGTDDVPSVAEMIFEQIVQGASASHRAQETLGFSSALGRGFQEEVVPLLPEGDVSSPAQDLVLGLGHRVFPSRRFAACPNQYQGHLPLRMRVANIAAMVYPSQPILGRGDSVQTVIWPAPLGGPPLAQPREVVLRMRS